MTTDPVQRLAAHAVARDGWLDATTRQLLGDERIAVAWLVGSLGQDAGDEWSDVDVVLVVRDAHLSALTQPLASCRCGSTGTSGRSRTARRPSDAWVLVERAVVPTAVESHAVLVAQSRAAAPQAVHDRFADPLDFAVAMVPIVAKYIARRQPEQAGELLRLLDRGAPGDLDPREQVAALRRILLRIERQRPGRAVYAAAAALDLAEALTAR